MSAFMYVLIPALIILAIVLYVYRPSAKKRYEQDAEIPLANDEARIPETETPKPEDSTKL